ncbi:DoxX family protein [Uliginosibacterium sp. sgz301328]|uniref:DoxX family protein n=1 Tax=Uliginosibacterium sp. sgz301328 TaxID=3243764 RepID=UPI00359E382C
MMRGRRYDVPPALVVLRIACGVFFIPHILFKLGNLAGATAFFAKAGIPYPDLFVYVAIALESLAALGLIIGVQVRRAALLGVTTLCAAAVATWLTSNTVWLWNQGGAEYPIFWALACVVVAIQYRPLPRNFFY